MLTEANTMKEAISKAYQKHLEGEQLRKEGSQLLGRLLVAQYNGLRRAAEAIGYEAGNLSTVVSGKRVLSWRMMVRLSEFLKEESSEEPS